MTTQEDFFTGSGVGNWTTAADWTEGDSGANAVPTSTQDAFIGFLNTAVVASQSNETVNSIGTNADSVLLINNDSTFTATNGTTLNAGDLGTTVSGNLNNITVEDGSTFEIGQGTFDNSGSVELNSSGTLTAFSFANSVKLTGGGTIEMSANANNYIKGAGGSSSLENVNNTISGGGNIGGGLNALKFTNDSGGTIETNNSLGTGTLQIVGSENGGSFTNNGSVLAQDGGTLVFGEHGATSTLVNNGSVELDSGGHATTLEIAGNTTITSAGAASDTSNIIVLAGSTSHDAIKSDGSTATLTLTNQFLKGAGTVGDSHLTLNVGSGSTVDADTTGQTLALGTGNNTINNAGLMETNNGGQLGLDSPVDNTGVILAADGTVFVLAPITGSGLVEIEAGGNLFTDSAIAGSVFFSGSGGELTLDNDKPNGDIGGQIKGAGAGDTIDLVGVTLVNGEHAVWDQTSTSGGTLSIYQDGSDLYTLNLAGTYNSLNFTVGNDGGGSTLITVQNTPVYSENPGNNDEWILSDGNWVESAAPGSHPPGYNVALTGDWTGNGTDGVLWFNPSTGDTDEWQLSNTQYSSHVDLGPHPTNSTDGNSYQIAGTDDATDFFGNGIDDVLWTSTNSDGTIATDIWQLNSSGNWTPTPGGSSPGPHPAGYVVAGTGDWTGDGTDGIMWFNASTGNVDEWQLSNGQWSPSSPGSLGSHPTNATDGASYQIAGVGDFFDNGRDGLLWTSVNSDGTVATDIWELNSSGTWMQSVSPGNHPAGYQVVGVGDFTGTGTSDILWFNPTTGDVDEWLMNNGAYAGHVDLGTHPPNSMDGASFQIAGVGDFNGAGNASVLWHSS
jgi:hypothetical protein